MAVTIKFIGRYKAFTGNKDLTLDIKPGSTIEQVINHIVTRFPELEKDKNFFIIAKNNIYTTREATVEEGDIITITPPVVSGG